MVDSLTRSKIVVAVVSTATTVLAYVRVKEIVRWWRGRIAKRRKKIEEGRNKLRWL